jgi:hypothetical protein
MAMVTATVTIAATPDTGADTTTTTEVCVAI